MVARVARSTAASQFGSFDGSAKMIPRELLTRAP
jgi:hypothetical protein